MRRRLMSTKTRRIRWQQHCNLRLKSIRSYILRLNNNCRKLQIIMIVIRLSGKGNTISLCNRSSKRSKLFKKHRRNLNRLCSIFRSIEKVIRDSLSPATTFLCNKLRNDTNLSCMRRKRLTSCWLIRWMIKLRTWERKWRIIRKN